MRHSSPLLLLRLSRRSSPHSLQSLLPARGAVSLQHLHRSRACASWQPSPPPVTASWQPSQPLRMQAPGRAGGAGIRGPHTPRRTIPRLSSAAEHYAAAAQRHGRGAPFFEARCARCTTLSSSANRLASSFSDSVWQRGGRARSSSSCIAGAIGVAVAGTFFCFIHRSKVCHVFCPLASDLLALLCEEGGSRRVLLLWCGSASFVLDNKAGGRTHSFRSINVCNEVQFARCKSAARGRRTRG